MQDGTSLSAHHCTTLSGYIFATKVYIDSRKKTFKQQYIFHTSSQYGELRRTNDWARFGRLGKGFRVLPSLLQRRRSTEANQTLHDVWPFHGLLHCIYIFGDYCPVTEFCQVQNSLCILQVLRSGVLVTLLQWARAKLRRWAQGATCVRQGDHHVGNWPTF